MISQHQFFRFQTLTAIDKYIKTVAKQAESIIIFSIHVVTLHACDLKGRPAQQGIMHASQ